MFCLLLSTQVKIQKYSIKLLPSQKTTGPILNCLHSSGKKIMMNSNIAMEICYFWTLLQKFNISSALNTFAKG